VPGGRPTEPVAVFRRRGVPNGRASDRRVPAITPDVPWQAADRDGKFGQEATDLLIASGMKPRRISPASPWQNGVAEPWIGSCRRELLNHVLIFNEAHLVRLANDYLSHYHTGRTHDGLEKHTPATRAVAPKPTESARLAAYPRVGGRHHRYDWQQAA
jgi:putative transposase